LTNGAYAVYDRVFNLNLSQEEIKAKPSTQKRTGAAMKKPGTKGNHSVISLADKIKKRKKAIADAAK
jgi:hypothetical protein